MLGNIEDRKLIWADETLLIVAKCGSFGRGVVEGYQGGEMIFANKISSELHPAICDDSFRKTRDEFKSKVADARLVGAKSAFDIEEE